MTHHRHPIWHAYMAAAAGHPPTRAEYDELVKLLDGHPHAREMRTRMADTFDRIGDFYDRGDNGAARDVARTMATSLIDRLPEHVTEPSEPDTNDPRELAARVPR